MYNSKIDKEYREVLMSKRERISLNLIVLTNQRRVKKYLIKNQDIPKTQSLKK
jgi:hypothetical protein